MSVINKPGIDSLKQVVTLLKPSGNALSFRAGEILKARIINVSSRGNVILRLLAHGDTQGTGKNQTLRAQTEVPLTKGQDIFLQVVKGDRHITMRYIGDSANAVRALQQNIPLRLLHLLSQASHSRMGSQDIQQFITMLHSLPQSIKRGIPEFQNLGKFLVNVRKIDGQQIRAFIERSGVLLETRLKIAAADQGNILEHLMALQNGGDLKSLLLKLRQSLKERSTVLLLQERGYSVSELTSRVDGFIRHIEFFQLTSRLQDMFCTFIPLLWDDLSDGEMFFRKDRKKGKGAYTCDLNLELKSLGKIALSITLADASFYLSVVAAEPGTADLIASHRHALEERFASQGLYLNALNVSTRKDISFGEVQNQGVNVRI